MRLLEILFYLLRINCKTTIKELAKKFNVSEKTIRRDLDKLSVLGIPIISYRGKNGGIEIDKNYIIAKYILTKADFEDLILSLYISENIMSDLKRANLIDKFKLVNSKRCEEILSNLEEKFIIDLKSEKDNNKNNINEVINKCLNEKSFVKIQLGEKFIEVLPISYILKNDGLYLYCYDGEYKLIPTKNLHNPCQCNKYYDGKIIKYKDNKKFLINI